MADEPPRTYGRGASQIPSGFYGVLTLLSVGSVVAFLYFARDLIVRIALAILLGFLLSPAVRWLRRWYIGRVTAVTITVLVAFLAMIGFTAVVLQEISSLPQQLPEYRSNLETKIRSLPGGTVKLDELIRVNMAARNSLMGLEEKSEGEVENIKSALVELASSTEETAVEGNASPS